MPQKKSKITKKKQILNSQLVLPFFFSLLLFLPFANLAYSTPKADRQPEYDVKVGFIYHFTKFIRWPKDAIKERGKFIIGVVGKDPFGTALDALAEKKKVNRRKLVIQRFSSPDEIKECHILFVSPSLHESLDKILKKVKGSPTLLIGDVPGFAKKGGGINFFLKNKKIRFEINRKALKKTGLKISSQLLNLAIIID